MESEITHDDAYTTESTWRIEGATSKIDKSLSALIETIQSKYPHDAMCIFTVISPNNNKRTTAKGLIINLDLVWIIGQTMLLMDQSETTDFYLPEMLFQITVFNPPKGGTRSTNQILNRDESRAIIRIDTKDGETNCCARSIVVGLACKKLLTWFKNKLTSDEINKINSRKRTKTQINEGIISDKDIKQIKEGLPLTLQGILADALHRICQVPFKKDGNDFQDIDQFSKQLNIKITVYNYNTKELMVTTTENTDLPEIILLYDNLHFDYLVNLTLAFPEKIKEKKEFDNNKCKICGQHNIDHYNLAPRNKNNKIIWFKQCDHCFRFFPTKECYDNHHVKKGQKNISDCDTFWHCDKCKHDYTFIERQPKDHKCYERKM
jgi:hypothetical protein